jgi:outer membrane lipoprotein-sorting protein
VLLTPALAGTPSADKIIAAMKRQYSTVNDYKADVSLTVKGPKVSINNMRMTVYFKKPNKIHVEATQGLAMVPSGNYFGDPLGHIGDNAHAKYLRTESRSGRQCYVLSLTNGQTPLTVWVDKQRSVMVAMDSERGLKTSWKYDRIDGKYYVPSEIRADVREGQGPAGSGPTKVTVKFSNYKVNKGIDDKIFQEKKQK